MILTIIKIYIKSIRRKKSYALQKNQRDLSLSFHCRFIRDKLQTVYEIAAGLDPHLIICGRIVDTLRAGRGVAAEHKHEVYR